jgi:predicted enzyme related to lactoylglutathione lyase/predicted small metal-binding protein
MTKVFECQDGFVARGADDDELLAEVERHVAEAHPDLVGKLSREEILAGARQEGPPLAECRVHAALPAIDLGRAKRFYAEQLGLTPSQEGAEGIGYECGDGSSFLLFPTSISGRGGHTQAGIEVPDIEAAVAGLRSRGVAFEEYDSPELKTVAGIATGPGGSKAAWFKDSEGNLLGLVQLA